MEKGYIMVQLQEMFVLGNIINLYSLKRLKGSRDKMCFATITLVIVIPGITLI